MKNMKNQAQNTQSRNARAATASYYFMDLEREEVLAARANGGFFSVVKPLTGEAADWAREFEAIGERERAEDEKERRKYTLVMNAYETPLEGDPLSGVKGISGYYRKIGFDVKVKAVKNASGKVVKGFKAVYIRRA